MTADSIVQMKTVRMSKEKILKVMLLVNGRMCLIQNCAHLLLKLETKKSGVGEEKNK